MLFLLVACLFVHGSTAPACFVHGSAVETNKGVMSNSRYMHNLQLIQMKFVFILYLETVIRFLKLSV
jgi:hypothetical protein